MVHRRFASLLAPALFVVACGSSDSPAAGTSSTGEDTTTEGSGESSGTEGETTGGPAWPYEHGYVKVSLSVAAGGDTALLDSTDTVVIAMDYGECLSAFYDANSHMLQASEYGSTVFGESALGGEGWEDLLCSPLFGTHAMCDIVWITQRFDAVRSLTVTYETMGELSTKPLLFGPIPTAATAGCDDGLEPTVVVMGKNSFRGIDAMGNDLWETESFAPGEAASRAEDPIEVVITPIAMD